MSAPRLTKKQKAEICAAYAAGESVKLIAWRYGVNESYPSLLAKRRGLKPRNKSGWMASAEATA